MQTIMTHGETVKSGGALSDGYVALRSDAYGLDDNTMGKTGWHVVYPQYDLLSDEVRRIVSEHNAARFAADESGEDACDDLPESSACPLCGSYCYGDCQAVG